MVTVYRKFHYEIFAMSRLTTSMTIIIIYVPKSEILISLRVIHHSKQGITYILIVFMDVLQKLEIVITIVGKLFKNIYDSVH